MKKQVNYTVFICDFCGKTIDNQQTYPYDKGWTYLHKFNAQIPPEDGEVAFIRVNIEDRHFCTKECMTVFLSKAIKYPEKTVSPEKPGMPVLFG